jgi:hypothetical protein
MHGASAAAAGAAAGHRKKARAEEGEHIHLLAAMPL